MDGSSIFFPSIPLGSPNKWPSQEELQQLREREAQQRQKHEEQLKDMRCKLEKEWLVAVKFMIMIWFRMDKNARKIVVHNSE